MRLISVRFSDAGLERECETGAGLTEADIVRAEESLKIGSGAFVAYFAGEHLLAAAGEVGKVQHCGVRAGEAVKQGVEGIAEGGVVIRNADKHGAL